jgi:succinate dehydrogenase / fumarate reductase flavoprotein subunit
VAAELDRIRNNTGTEKAARLRKEMQDALMDNVGVFRDGKLIGAAIEKVRELKARFGQVQIDDKGQRFNTDLLETFELGCLLDLAEVTAVSALNRTESRGAHFRDDYAKRDDAQWLKHTFARHMAANGAGVTGGKIEISYRPVSITKFEPKERKY